MKKIYMLTGLPCSGKTTIGKKLADKLPAVLLDGDDIRLKTQNTDFTIEGRSKHIYDVTEKAYNLSKENDVIIALVNPIKKVRQYLKDRYRNIIEVYVKCGLKECKKRDVKGMYAKALNGEIKDFTGVDAVYEKPENPDIIVDTEHSDIRQCVYDILNYSKDDNVYSMFIGRFQFVHQGHVQLINKVLAEGKKVLVALRDTKFNDSNPYTIHERIKMFREYFTEDEVKIITIPDIKEICYGRGVGYNIRELHLDKELEDISATKMRAEHGG